MIRNMRRGVPNFFKQGTQHLQGIEEAVLKNLQACKALTDVTRTSLGPNGMNKMIINHLDKLFVTSDAATIMQQMEIQHPAAKMIVMASAMQEKEVGDGSNFVVCLAGELLAKAEELVIQGLHPSEILSGFDRATEEVLRILEELVVEEVKVEDLKSEAAMIRAVKTAVSSKQHGYEDFLSPLIAKACMTVMPPRSNQFNVDNVRVVKVLGGDIYQSEVVKGMVLAMDTLGTVKSVKDAHIAVFTCSISAAETESKGTVLLKNAEDLMNYNASEEADMEKTIRAIHECGVNVIITNGAVDEIAMHYIEKYGIMLIKNQSKFEIRRLCRATKARPIVTLGPIPAEHQGFCSSVAVREVGNRNITIFAQEQQDDTSVATILLRASTHNILNDVERAIDDGVNTARAVGKDGRFVSGAGAVDIELARRLAQVGAKTSGLEQYAINKFAEALEVVPRTLAQNAGLNPTEVLANLYAAHEKGDVNAGVNIDGEGVIDAKKEGVLDLYMGKRQAIKLACDAAITVLRVDTIIQAKQAGGPKTGNKDHHD